MIPLTIANGIVPYFMAQTTSGVLLLIPIIIIEAILITKFLKEGFGKSVKFCTVANVVSTLAGICFIFIEIPIYSLSELTIIILLLLMFVVAFIVSILLEYKIYRYFWKDIGKRRLFKAVIIVNIITYIPLTILAVYAFRSNARAPEKACRISCISNLKVIGIAMMQYSMDNDYLPDKSGAEGLEQLRCNGYFSDYSDHRIYVCPTTRNPKVEDSKKLTEKDVDYIYKGGFKHKYKNIGNYYNETDYSKIPVVWDKPTNHENYGNVLFLDGHVEGFKGKDWMEQAGIRKSTTQENKKIEKTIEERIKLLPYKSKADFYDKFKRDIINKIKDPVCKKIALTKSFKKWKKYEDTYISFIYPDHPKIKLEIEKNTKYKKSPVIASYKLMVGNNKYCLLTLNKGTNFDNDECMCGAVAFSKYLFADKTLLRFSLLSNGYVKHVQALSDKIRVDVDCWTHLNIQQVPYIKIASSIRFKESTDIKQLKKKYDGMGFLEKGMTRKQVIKLLGKPTKEEPSKLIYDHSVGLYVGRYTIEFNKNGTFESFKKGWYKTLRLKPKYGSIDWIEEKVDKYCFKVDKAIDENQENDDDEKNKTKKKKPEDYADKEYYKEEYSGTVITYNLGPLTIKEVNIIFDRFIELAPKANSKDWIILCRALNKLARCGYMDNKILPVFIARYSKELMPYAANRIVQRYRPKNRNQLLIAQTKLIYDYARKTKNNDNDKYFDVDDVDLSAINILLLYAPKKAQELILTGMRHPNSKIRRQAYKFWDKLPVDKIISLLRKGLKEKDSDIRSECADAFCEEIGTNQDLKLLKNALQKEKENYIKDSLKSAIKRISEGKKGTKVMFGND